jgi:hypothetical protein
VQQSAAARKGSPSLTRLTAAAVAALLACKSVLARRAPTDRPMQCATDSVTLRWAWGTGRPACHHACPTSRAAHSTALRVRPSPAPERTAGAVRTSRVRKLGRSAVQCSAPKRKQRDRSTAPKRRAHVLLHLLGRLAWRRRRERRLLRLRRDALRCHRDRVEKLVHFVQIDVPQRALSRHALVQRLSLGARRRSGRVLPEWRWRRRGA